MISSASYRLLGASEMGGALSVAAWVLIAALIAVAGLYVIRLVRGWSQREEAVRLFTLQDLRAMKSTGQISAEEYEALRKNVIREASQEPSPPSSPSPPSGLPDDPD